MLCFHSSLAAHVHPKAIQAQARRLAEVARAAEPVSNLSERSESFRLISRHGISCVLAGEALEKHHEIIDSLLNESEWGDKFSEKHVTSKVEEILCTVLREGDKAHPEEHVAELAEEFDSFDERRIVYVPLAGLRVSKDVEMGAVKLVNMTEEVCDEIYRKVEAIITVSPNPQPAKDSMLESIRQDLANRFLGHVCAKFEVVAEQTRAKERAEDEARRALDLLRFSIPTIFRDNQQVQVGLAGEVGYATRQTFSLVPNRRWSQSDNAVGSVTPFKLTPDSIERMEDIGVFKLSRLLQKDEAALNDLERVILRSVHWFANAQSQPEIENQFLNLIISLETLLTPRDGNPIGTAIAEGVAFLLTEGVEERRAMRKRIKRFYGQRSAVAHGGKKPILQKDLVELKNTAGSLIVRILHFDEPLHSQKDLLAWIEERKFS